MDNTKKDSRFYVPQSAAGSGAGKVQGDEPPARVNAETELTPEEAEQARRAEARRIGNANLRPFRKGDPRINYEGGRLQTIPQLRALIQDIGAEVINVKVGKGEKARVLAMTRFQKLVLEMFASRDPATRKLLLEYAFGKVPHTVDLQSGGKAISWLEFIGRDVLEGDVSEADVEAGDDQSLTLLGPAQPDDDTGS